LRTEPASGSGAPYYLGAADGLTRGFLADFVLAMM
jgi:hypothetical protein